MNRLKAMVYLSESVAQEQGAFSYVVGSHLWNRDRGEMIVRKAIRTSGLYLRDEATRRMFAALPSWLQLKNDIGSELEAGAGQARQMIEHTRVYPSSSGRLVVFDPNGVHCGGVVRRGRRDAMQVVFCKA